MFPSSSSSMSSSSEKSAGPSFSNIGGGGGGGNLTRYVSAPGSLLASAVDSVIGNHRTELSPLGSHSQAPHHHLMSHYFSGSAADSSLSFTSSESTCKVNSSNDPREAKTGLQRSYGFNEIASRIGGSSSSPSSLVRQSSSPAGFLSHFPTENVSRIKSQLSFNRQESCLSQISEGSENGIEANNAQRCYSPASFGMDSWDSASASGNSIVFSSPSNKRTKNLDGDFFNYTLDSQFSLPQTSLEMATVEKLLHIPEDSVPCKIRAKRGCATHPRSIAERERRTRISGKLKKLQDLVPNMDKQTSYADMLDLAVQHIKGLQTQVQKLRKEVDNCVCGGCKPTS